MIMNETNIGKIPKVSVIIPVWNPGQGIDRCIESLRKQTLEEIELIFVDDCGTDDAMEKVRAAEAEEPRIRVITNPRNLGPGPSRNAGIEAARGEYLSFVDPDDFVAPDFLDILYNSAVSNGADIAKGDCVYRKGDGSYKVKRFSLNKRILAGLSENKPLYTLFTQQHWSAVYRHQLFENEDIRYSSDKRGQDTYFLLTVCTYAERIILCDHALYTYCERADSAVHMLNHQGWIALGDELHNKMEFILSHNEKNDAALSYIVKRIHYFLQLSWSVRRLDIYKKGKEFYLGRAIKMILEFPWADELKKRSVSVRALTEYGECLPDHVYVSSWDQRCLPAYIELAMAWLRFIIIHPRYMPGFGKMVFDNCMLVMKILLSRLKKYE